MLRVLYRLHPSPRSQHIVNGDRHGVATAAQKHNPNAGNFDSWPREDLPEIGHWVGKKGKKARGVGGFDKMEFVKQV